jgi:hypothetical protein
MGALGQSSLRRDLGELESARWTSTVPHPFAPAPGAGMGVINTKTQRGDIGPDQLPVIELRTYVMRRGPVAAPVFDASMLPLLEQIGYQAGESRVDTFPLTVTWSPDPSEKELWEAKVSNKAGPFSGEVVDILAGSPTPEDSRGFPTVGTVWTVNLRPRDGVFNDGKLAILNDTIRNARRGLKAQLGLGTASTKHGMRVFGERKPRKKAGPTPRPPVPKPKPAKPVKPAAPMLKAGAGIGIFLIAYNMLTSQVGSVRI